MQVKGQIQLFMSLGAKGGGGLPYQLLLKMNFIVKNVNVNSSGLGKMIVLLKCQTNHPTILIESRRINRTFLLVHHTVELLLYETNV